MSENRERGEEREDRGAVERAPGMQIRRRAKINMRRLLFLGRGKKPGRYFIVACLAKGCIGEGKRIVALGDANGCTLPFL